MSCKKQEQERVVQIREAGGGGVVTVQKGGGGLLKRLRYSRELDNITWS